MENHDHLLRRSLVRIAASLGLVALFATSGSGAPFVGGHLQPAVAKSVSSGGNCSFGNGIQHVIYLQFDNTHLTRDNPNVPSDLESMPHLLSFMKDNGVVLANHHTPLIAHTSEDILTSLTGVYPNRHGVAVGQNSYQFYTPDGSQRNYTSAFTYWTDTIGGKYAPNGTYNMLSGAPTAAKPTGTNAPAPWVPYTRNGCDFGAAGTANTVLENTNVTSPYGANDIANAFGGTSSPEAVETLNDQKKGNPAATKAIPSAEYVGIAVHCSQADSLSSGKCSISNHARPDTLLDEPNGYDNFNALFGHKYVAPIVSPTGPVTDIFGNTIQDSYGNVGFPGFDGLNAGVTLGYIAAMQEHGIPVTYGYISDSHDLQGAASHTALGPGESSYEAQLQRNDQAFAAFFQRLANDGINKSNTLFVITSDEGDHFTGAPGSPAGCTGASIDNSTNPPTVTPGNYCTYTKTPTTGSGPPFGEIATGLQGLLKLNGSSSANSDFTVGNDTAPGVYLKGQPARDGSAVRSFEQDTAALVVHNQLTGNDESLTQYMADPVEMNLLHMVTQDPTRTPTFTMFARPDYYVTGTCYGGYDSDLPPHSISTSNCVQERPAYAWLHGNVQPDITTTWLGVVGPGVQNLGMDSSIWSDHTDIRPTMLSLLGLTDDYSHDGRALVEIMDRNVVPHGADAHHETWLQLAQVYKQLNAPVGEFGLATLQASTTALESKTVGDTTYASLEGQLQTLGGQRDALAGQIAAELEDTMFNGGALNEQTAKDQIAKAQDLITQADNLAP